jgi:hypothetical protein
MGMADALTGRTARKQYNLAAEAQARQAAAIARQEADVAAVEAGQRRLNQGGNGMLAFVNRRRAADEGLRSTMGGSYAA